VCSVHTTEMISGVVHLTSKTIYGFTARHFPIYLFKPFDTSIPDLLVGCSEKDRTHNVVALVEKGTIRRILGKCGDRAAEEEALLWRYCPLRWKKIEHLIVQPSFERKLLDVPTINIDPPNCRDIDDCVSIWKEEYKTFVAITIADVHAWIKVNPWLESHAASIGQTFYKNGSAEVSMLPEIFSTHLCSLVPNERRLGVSLIFEWNGTQIVDPKFHEVIIINKQSCQYGNVTNFPVGTLQAVASHIGGCEMKDSHDWIEQLMLFYNRCAAICLIDMGKGIYRGHPPPDILKLESYKKMGVENLAYSSGIYSIEPITHWGLKYDAYCHASSPIRRWSDVVNQGILKGDLSRITDTDHLNIVASNAKKYERDLFFVGRLFEQNKPVEGIVLTKNDERARVWIISWKRIITLRYCNPPVGDRIMVSYYLNMENPTWKRRMVFRCEGTMNPGQQYL
jgi:exoribonuclease R